MSLGFNHCSVVLLDSSPYRLSAPACLCVEGTIPSCCRVFPLHEASALRFLHPAGSCSLCVVRAEGVHMNAQLCMPAYVGWVHFYSYNLGGVWRESLGLPYRQRINFYFKEGPPDHRVCRAVLSKQNRGCGKVLALLMNTLLHLEAARCFHCCNCLQFYFQGKEQEGK